ncbi:MAG TPA: type II toxin-antitoxin system VapC family toxin [Parvibaculum sp.]
MPFVVDASISACWLLPDERDDRADDVMARFGDDLGLAPDIWWFEVHNLLLTSERRKRISPDRTEAGLSLLLNLPIELDNQRDAIVVLDLARRHNLTFYDAAYLELALRKTADLASRDTALIAAARAEQVPVL